MKWEYTTIGDHCTVTSSKRFHLSERSTTGVPFYCSKEIIQKVNGEEISDCDFIKEESYENVKKQYGVPESGDLLITTRGTYGIPYIYRDTDRFYFADGNLTWLKDFDGELLVKYLYYWILSYEGQKKMDAIAKGTAQKAVPIASIKMLQLPLPPVDVQERIAEVLFAYDNLIENNQKQIKLLEEAAQRLYKEWFVDLRFPGYEDTPIVDSVPKGWASGVIGDIAEFKRGKTITKKQAVKGEIPVVAGGKEPAYWHNKANTGNPVITVSASGNAGFTRMYYKKVWASDCSYLDCNATENLFYVYLHLKYRQDDIYSMQKGACQQHVNAKEINAMKMLIPANDVLQSFVEIISPYFERISSLERQIHHATQARDRLLPKLMSGEIEV